MAAQRHYWDYKIADGQGNVDGRLGIKLQQTGVQVLEAFDQSKTTTIKEDRGQKVHLRVFNDDRAHLAEIQSQLDFNSRADAFHYCLELAQSLLTTAVQIDVTPEQLITKLTDLASDSKLPSVPEVEAEQLELDDNLLDFSTNKHHQQLSLAENQNKSEPTITNSSDSSSVNQTEELSPQNSPTTTPSEALFAKLDRQQESLSSLTNAIHGLVKVLANSPSSTNPSQHSEGKAKSEHSSDLVQSQPKIEPPSNLKPSELTTTKRKRRSELSRQKVNQYIERIMAYNDVKERRRADKWLITIAALKRLTHCGQSVIYDVLHSRESEIQFHHDKHQLGIYHNQKGKNSTKIESVIS